MATISTNYNLKQIAEAYILLEVRLLFIVKFPLSLLMLINYLGEILNYAI